MVIKIIGQQTDLHMTIEDYNRLLEEYRKEIFYGYPIPSFEEWVKGKNKTLLNEEV